MESRDQREEAGALMERGEEQQELERGAADVEGRGHGCEVGRKRCFFAI